MGLVAGKGCFTKWQKQKLSAQLNHKYIKEAIWI